MTMVRLMFMRRACGILLDGGQSSVAFLCVEDTIAAATEQCVSVLLRAVDIIYHMSFSLFVVP